tara:strand:+ start:4224 stop:4427 length:204 start_codon:yes stop_codon:yes gene_type:complete
MDRELRMQVGGIDGLRFADLWMSAKVSAGLCALHLFGVKNMLTSRLEKSPEHYNLHFWNLSNGSIST